MIRDIMDRVVGVARHLTTDKIADAETILPCVDSVSDPNIVCQALVSLNNGDRARNLARSSQLGQFKVAVSYYRDAKVKAESVLP